MSETAKLCVSAEVRATLSDLERIFKLLDYNPGCTKADYFFPATIKSLLNGLNAGTRAYLQQIQVDKWPPRLPIDLTLSRDEIDILKDLLGCALEYGKYEQAVAVVQLLDNTSDHVTEASLLNDVLQHVHKKQKGHVIPPQLALRWAKILHTKGDLHGAVRKLNYTKALLEEQKDYFCCANEVERIRNECTQLKGFTLNTMCCWKDAIIPFYELVETFRNSSAEVEDKSFVVSLAMSAKCIASITHEDFLELKKQLKFQYKDRFYQAYSLCKEAAAACGSMAVNSELRLFARVQVSNFD